MTANGWQWPDPATVELTDRRSDPEERANLADAEPELAQQMARLLEAELNAKLRGEDPFREELRERIWTGGSLWN